MKSKIFVLVAVFIGLIHQIMAQKAKEVTGKQVGEKIANFTAKDQFGRKFQLSEALKKGSVVVVFYRGQWCPVCNKHLAKFEENIEQFKEKGATIVAVSPEKPEFINKTIKKTKASYVVLHDEDYKIAQLFDVIFEPSDTEKATYNTVLGANLKEAHSDDSGRLPIPATFIINKESKITWRQFDPNYKKRSDIQEVVNNIPRTK